MRDLLQRYTRLSEALSGAIAALEGQVSGTSLSPLLEQAEKPHDTATASLELATSDVDALLRFQEQLSQIPGVVKITMAGAREGRSRLLIELARETPALVVCSNCGKVLVEGEPPASHGLCDDCRTTFGGSAALR
jgi:hypothetical protein